jgi:hypothetical protein
VTDMQRSSSKLFLLEMAIILVFFSFAAAVCTNLFVKAKVLSVESTELTMATLKAQAAAEAVEAAGGEKEELARLLEGSAGQDGVIVSYDEDWRQAAQGRYSLTVLLTRKDALVQAEITVSKAQEEIFGLNTGVLVREVAP